LTKNPRNDFGLISIVVPLYNEAGNVGILNEAIHNALKGFKYELLLVNDGSTDGTGMQLKKLKHPNLIVIELEKNYGQSLALAAGIDTAKGDYIVTMDGDLQNDPRDIPWMLEKAKDENWDLVTGIRSDRKDSILKTIPSTVANRIIRLVTNLNIKDHGCALKVFTKNTAKELDLHGEIHRYISLLSHFNGARITQVPVRHNARKFGISKYGLERIFRVVCDLVLLVYFQHRRARNEKYSKPKKHKRSYVIKAIQTQKRIYKKKFQTIPNLTIKSR
jgi:glycosyltransferase involved in cell wall biosynthesis